LRKDLETRIGPFSNANEEVRGILAYLLPEDSDYLNLTQ